MTLRNFYFHIDNTMFKSEMVHKKLDKIKRSRFNTNFASDFDFQTDFFSRHIELALRRHKYQGAFKTLILKPSQSYKIESNTESIAISIPFNLEKYQELYPNPNLYPLQLNAPIIPILNTTEFNEFLFTMLMGALNYAESERVDLPITYIKETLNTFKKDNYTRDWFHKKKAFKEIGISTRLYCYQNCNYFSLQLIVLKKNKEFYRVEIRREKPSYLSYSPFLGEIRLKNNHLLIVDSLNDYLPLKDQKTIFKLPLKTIL